MKANSKPGAFASVFICGYSCKKEKKIPYKRAQNVTNIHVFIRKMHSVRLELMKQIGFYLINIIK